MKWLVRHKNCMKKSEGCSTMVSDMSAKQIRNFWLKWEVFCLEKEKHCIPASEPYSICETWLWESRGPATFHCIWPRKICHSTDGAMEFKWNSKGKCHDILLLSASEENMGHAETQLPHQTIKNSHRRTKWCFETNQTNKILKLKMFRTLKYAIIFPSQCSTYQY